MSIKAISGTCQKYFTMSSVKKTKIENGVTALFIQRGYFSPSSTQNQLLLFSCKGRITWELKDHFHCPSDTKYIEGIAECFDNLIIESEDVEKMVVNVMKEKKFPVSEYAIIFQEKITTILKNSAIEFKGV